MDKITTRNKERATYILDHYSRSLEDKICLARQLDRDDKKLLAAIPSQMLTCNCCGSTDISDEPEVKYPENCVCWEDWFKEENIPPICNFYESDTGDSIGICVNCSHNEECHNHV